jgi:3-dehydroquinate synthase
LKSLRESFIKIEIKLKTIVISTGTKNSELRIGENWQNVKTLLPAGDIVIITDENINRLYGSKFPKAHVIVIPAGESSKNYRIIEKITKKILKLNIDRTGFILGIGGGVVCDITGFVASIYLRGIGFGFISTTLLSQVDASVGGKNGINLGGAKNMIGNFNQPLFVICDQTMLKTLPEDEYISGLGELIKHAIIKDKALLEIIKKEKARILSRDVAVMEKVIAQSVQIKADIVASDEREDGVRRLLNFGHTFGHSIELKYGYGHGMAVATGMVMAAQFSYFKGMIKKSEVDQISTILGSFSLLKKADLSGRVIGKMLIHDKKRTGDSIHFVLLKSIGNAVVEKVSLEDVREFLGGWKSVNGNR